MVSSLFRWRGLMAASCITLTACGCSSSSVDVDLPPPDVMELTTGDGVFSTSSLARLDLYFSKSPSAQFSLTVVQGGGRMWGVHLPMTPEQALSGTVSVPIESGADSVGSARVSLYMGEAGTPLQAESGTFELTIEHGQVTGTVKGTGSAQLDASFKGKVGIGCSVPASSLSEPPESGLVPDDEYSDVEILSPDMELESTECSPYAKLIQ